MKERNKRLRAKPLTREVVDLKRNNAETISEMCMTYGLKDSHANIL